MLFNKGLNSFNNRYQKVKNNIIYYYNNLKH